MGEKTDETTPQIGPTGHPMIEHTHEAATLLNKINEALTHPVDEDDLDIIKRRLRKVRKGLAAALKTLEA